MAYLSYPSATTLQLRLEEHEQAILSVVRKCPWWRSAEVEGRRPDSPTVSAVILTTGREMDATLRRILTMCAGLAFPEEGGPGAALPRQRSSTSDGKRRRS